jgi:hypothetical protein
MRFRNVSPLGDLSIVGVGEVPAGGEFDGPDDLAEQPENFQPVDPAVPTITPTIAPVQAADAPAPAQNGVQS